MYPIQVYLFMFYLVGIGLLTGITIGLLIFDKEVRTKLMRIVFRKNYGIIYFISRNKTVFSTTANLSNSVFRFKDRIFLFKDKYVYVLKPSIVKGADLTKILKKTPREEELREYLIKKLELDAKKIKQGLIGIPILLFNYDDIAPVDLASGESSEKFRDSKFVSGILDQEIEIERKKAIVSETKKMNIKTIISIVMIGIVALMVVVLFFKINTLSKQLHTIYLMLNQTIKPATVV